MFGGIIWQDLVLTGGAFVFAALLVPTLRDRSAEIPRTTSIPTGVTLVIFSGTFSTMDLYLSSIANLLTAAAWFLIAAYRPRKTE
jgi:uncharacterized SAM-binding protein YcdF (DUF218 family)